MRAILFILSVALSFCLTTGQLQCKNELGKPVDWFVMYKIPIISKDKNFLLRNGLGYIYVTSEDSSADWKLSSKSINDTSSLLGNTLAPLYDNSSIFHVLYNDDPPTTSGSLFFGHTKGVVLFDGFEGLWLIHSSPKFPIEPVTEKTVNGTNGPKQRSSKNHYFYPKSAVKYGQSFLCISLPSDQMDAVGLQLMYNRPRIYSSNVPDKIKSKYRNLTRAASNEFIKSPPWNHKVNLQSKGKVDFVSYAKARQFNKELYSDWVAADLAADLNVETWSNGAGELPSNCKNKFQVLDVKRLSFNVDQDKIQFKNSQDHSKWAVTLEKDNAFVCIGDINRMAAQLKRGGGTVCLRDPELWKKYSKSVVEVEPCPLH